MTWNSAKARAAEVLRGLRSELPDHDVRLVLRALQREFQTTKATTPMQPDQIVLEDRDVLAELARLGALEHLTTLKASGKACAAFGGPADTWLLTRDTGQPDERDNGWTLSHWPLDLLKAEPVLRAWLTQLDLDLSTALHVPLPQDRN